MPNDWGDYEGSGAALADSLLPSFLTPQRRQQAQLQPAMPPLPGALPGLPPMPGGAPPPGFLAGALGGLETPAGVAGTPVPLGPSSTTPGGMSVTPVSTPQSAPAPSNGPLDALRQQMGVINQLVGAAPQQPFVRDQINEGPTQMTGRHGGFGGLSSGPSQVTANQGDLANLATFNQLQAGRGQDVGQLLGRLSTMGNQALQGGQLSLDTMRLLGVNGQQGSMARENALAQSNVDANGINRLLETQLGAAHNQHMQNPANGRTAAERQASWDRLNMPMPAYTGRGGSSPAVLAPASQASPGSAPAAPIAALAPALGGGTRATPNLAAESPEALISAAHGPSMERAGATLQPHGGYSQLDSTQSTNAISDMIMSLNTRPGFVNGNRDAIIRSIVDQHGPQAFQNWMTRAALGGTPFGNHSIHNQAMRAFNGQ